MSHNGQKHDEEDRQIYTQMDFDIGNSRGILPSKNAIHWLWLKNSILSKVKTCGIENQSKFNLYLYSGPTRVDGESSK